jgi:hypothetical protein
MMRNRIFHKGALVGPTMQLLRATARRSRTLRLLSVPKRVDCQKQLGTARARSHPHYGGSRTAHSTIPGLLQGVSLAGGHSFSWLDSRRRKNITCLASTTSTMP